jgi:hypothetical protein
MPQRKASMLITLTFLFVFSCGLLPTSTPQIVKETIEVEVTKEVIREVEITTTPEPTPMPTPLAPLILEENFDDDQGEWYLGTLENSSVEIRDGQLILSVDATNIITSSSHPEFDTLRIPFDLSVQITNLGPASTGYASIYFRYADDDNLAEFAIAGDGFVAFWVILEGEYYDIIPWIRATAIDQDSNNIQLIDYGDRVVAYLNGDLFFNIPFEDIPLGSIGFSVGTYDEDVASFGFDGVILREARR